VTLVSKAHGLRVEDALLLRCEGDRGDEYNFDPVPGGVVAERFERVRVRSLRRGAAEVGLRIDATLRVPRELTPARDVRTERRVALPITLELRLAAGLERVDVALTIDNAARDHRLRLHCRAPFAPAQFEVESAFEIAERPIAPAPDAFGSPRPAEFPIGAVPQRSFATLAGSGGLALTVANRGVAEVEAVAEPDGRGALALTVLRAVGWLSRSDLRSRPGPAGPGLPTPGAQVPGRHRIEISLRLHRADDPRRIAEAHGFAFPPIAFAGADDGDGVLADGARIVTVDDPQVLVSAVEPRGDGDAELRLVNASGDTRSLRVAWGATSRSLQLVDLAGRDDGTPSPESASANAGAMVLGPWQIVTLRTRVGPT
jgi:alpha-mannosidase